MDLEPSFECESSIVYRSSSAAVVVPRHLLEGIDDAEKNRIVHRSLQRTPETPTDVIRLEPYTDEPRLHSDRAAILALLFDKVGQFEFQHDDVVRSTPETARIPVQVAATGTTATACYLGVHALDNSAIANLLGIGQRTVSQYISDFRRGER